MSSRSSSLSSSFDSDVGKRCQQRFQELYGTYETPAETSPQTQDLKAVESLVEGDADGEYQFRLFAKGPQPAHLNSPPPQRIIVRSPSLDAGQGDFVVRERPRDYFFAANASAQDLADYKAAAVTGEDVLTRAKTRWVRQSQQFRA